MYSVFELEVLLYIILIIILLHNEKRNSEILQRIKGVRIYY